MYVNWPSFSCLAAWSSAGFDCPSVANVRIIRSCNLDYHLFHLAAFKLECSVFYFDNMFSSWWRCYVKAAAMWNRYLDVFQLNLYMLLMMHNVQLQLWPDFCTFWYSFCSCFLGQRSKNGIDPTPACTPASLAFWEGKVRLERFLLVYEELFFLKDSTIHTYTRCFLASEIMECTTWFILGSTCYQANFGALITFRSSVQLCHFKRCY